MDNNSSDILLQSSESSFPSFGSSDSGSIFDSIRKVNGITWLIIILILAFLGFNIFAYLAQGTQDVTNFFSPILKKLFGVTIMATGEAVDTAAEGAKVVVGGTAGAIEGGLTAIQEITPNQAPSSNKGQPIQPQMKQTSLNKALSSTPPQHQQPQDYQANEASSSYDGTGGKSGWCYIGDDRGYRTCAEVSASDTCMSGDIFPSQEICMNPNLRY